MNSVQMTKIATIVYIIFLLAFSLRCTQEQATENVLPGLQEKVAIVKEARVSIAGGTTWQQNTVQGVLYDVNFSISLENVSGDVQFIGYDLSVGVLIDDQFSQDEKYVVNRDNTSLRSSSFRQLNPEDTITIRDSSLIALGRTSQAPWTYPYAFKLQIRNSKNETFTVIDTVSGSCPENRFSGITETGPSGPAPIGNIDPNDWKPLSISGDTYYLSAAYPNPTSDACSVHFQSPGEDSLIVSLNDTPSHVIKTIASRRLSPGVYLWRWSNSDLESGIYRVYFAVVRPHNVYVTYGDIKIQR